MNIEVRGEGPDLLLVHGFGTSRKVWEPLLPHLGGFRLWLLDLPGHGESPWSPGALTMEALIEALSSLPLREAWGMGWSMGGLILAAFAQRFPGRLSRLFMVASTPRFLQGPDWPWGLDPDVFHGFRRELREHPGKVLRRFAALQVQGAEGGREAFKGLLDALSWACPGALEEGMALLEDTDLRSRLPQARWILGGRDRIVSPGLARLLEARVIPGAGHAPFLSHPGAFMEAFRG